MNRILKRMADYLRIAKSEKFKEEDIQTIADSTDLQFQQGLNNMLERYNVEPEFNLDEFEDEDSNEETLPITEKVNELQSDRDFKLEFDNAIEHFDEQFAIDVVTALQKYLQNASINNDEDTNIKELSENDILLGVDNIIQIMNNIFSQEKINYDECNRYSLTVKEIFNSLKEKFDL